VRAGWAHPADAALVLKLDTEFASYSPGRRPN